VNQHVDGITLELGEEVSDFVVLQYIAAIALDGGIFQQQQPHTAEELLLIADENMRAMFGESLGDSPSQAGFVGHAEHHDILPFQTHSAVVRWHVCKQSPLLK